MQRTLPKIVRISIASVAAALLIAGGVYAYATTHQGATLTTNTQHQLTALSYSGKQGVDALTLLKQHATIQVKHYSFGDQVIAINGVAGNGPKYWTFYINDTIANVGASAYRTKDSDTLKWVLQ